MSDSEAEIAAPAVAAAAVLKCDQCSEYVLKPDGCITDPKKRTFVVCKRCTRGNKHLLKDVPGKERLDNKKMKATAVTEFNRRAQMMGDGLVELDGEMSSAGIAKNSNVGVALKQETIAKLSQKLVIEKECVDSKFGSMPLPERPFKKHMENIEGLTKEEATAAWDEGVNANTLEKNEYNEQCLRVKLRGATWFKDRIVKRAEITQDTDVTEQNAPMVQNILQQPLQLHAGDLCMCR